MYKKYKYYNHKKRPDIFDMVIEITAGVMYLLGKLVFKLFSLLFQKHPKINFSLQKGGSNLVNTSVFADNAASTQIPTESRYTLKEGLLTEAEKKFLKVLEQVVGNTYRIESQVLLSGIVKPTDSNQHYTNYRDFNIIKAKSIDFVLYDKDYKPYLAIELDDGSHRRWDRIKRDHIVDEIMRSVGLRIIHIPVSYSYNIEELREKVFTNH